MLHDAPTVVLPAVVDDHPTRPLPPVEPAWPAADPDIAGAVLRDPTAPDTATLTAVVTALRALAQTPPSAAVPRHH